jgi:hypothetical protein
VGSLTTTGTAAGTVGSTTQSFTTTDITPLTAGTASVTVGGFSVTTLTVCDESGNSSTIYVLTVSDSSGSLTVEVPTISAGSPVSVLTGPASIQLPTVSLNTVVGSVTTTSATVVGSLTTASASVVESVTTASASVVESVTTASASVVGNVSAAPDTLIYVSDATTSELTVNLQTGSAVTDVLVGAAIEVVSGLSLTTSEGSTVTGLTTDWLHAGFKGNAVVVSQVFTEELTLYELSTAAVELPEFTTVEVVAALTYSTQELSIPNIGTAELSIPTLSDEQVVKSLTLTTKEASLPGEFTTESVLLELEITTSEFRLPADFTIAEALLNLTFTTQQITEELNFYAAKEVLVPDEEQEDPMVVTREPLPEEGPTIAFLYPVEMSCAAPFKLIDRGDLILQKRTTQWTPPACCDQTGPSAVITTEDVEASDCSDIWLLRPEFVDAPIGTAESCPCYDGSPELPCTAPSDESWPNGGQVCTTKIMRPQRNWCIACANGSPQ